MGPERWRKMTEWVVIGTAVLLALYDVAARVFGGNEAALSAVLLDAARQWPIVAVVAGAIVGHIFWGVR
jgi:hypothetical protein